MNHSLQVLTAPPLTALVGTALAFLATSCVADDDSSQPYGMDARTEWRGSRVIGSPDPPLRPVPSAIAEGQTAARQRCQRATRFHARSCAPSSDGCVPSCPPVSESRCVQDDELLGLSGGLLPAVERLRVERHLEACASCARVVRVLAQAKLAVADRAAAATLGVADTHISDRSLDAHDAPATAGEVYPAAEGRYRLPEGGLVELGAGGLGRVLLARDAAFGRDVALKEIAEVPPGARALVGARFVREARLAGQLEHPGIVPVYDFAKDASGRLFYVTRSCPPRLRWPRTCIQPLANASEKSPKRLIHGVPNALPGHSTSARCRLALSVTSLTICVSGKATPAAR